MKDKKTIKIKFVDFYKSFKYEESDFYKILCSKYDVVVTDKPDYIFYSCFGYEHLKYDCVRIFYTGECITPDFNECDYAIGFDRLDFGDRYLRYPLYKLFQYKAEYQSLFDREQFTIDDLKKKEGFCSFVVSNCFADDIRAKFFDKLSQYKTVASGGRYKNNIGGCVIDKRDFQSKHKFAICFENTSYDGYATEKLMEGFVAGAIPIYFGDTRISEDFNPKAFLNLADYRDMDALVEKVVEIDLNDELYLAMRNEKPVLGVEQYELDKFLYAIFDQDIDKAYRRPLSRSSISIEKMKLRHTFYETKIYPFFSKIKNTLVRLKTKTKMSAKRTK